MSRQEIIVSPIKHWRFGQTIEWKAVSYLLLAVNIDLAACLLQKLLREQSHRRA